MAGARRDGMKEAFVHYGSIPDQPSPCGRRGKLRAQTPVAQDVTCPRCRGSAVVRLALAEDGVTMTAREYAADMADATRIAADALLRRNEARRRGIEPSRYSPGEDNPYWDGERFRFRAPPEVAWLPYKEYLRSPYWGFLSECMKEWANRKCKKCGTRHDLGGLDVHHLTYVRRGNEYPSDLAVLCRACHAAVHIGGWRDIESGKLVGVIGKARALA